MTLPQQSQDEITLREVLGVLTRRKWLIICVTAIFTVGAAIAAWLVPKDYRAMVVVSPVSDDSAGNRLGGASSLISQFGGLASLAGLPVSGNTQKAETVAVLQSEALTEKYIESNNLLPVLYWRKWDSSNRAWRQMDPEDVPTLWKANQLFTKSVRGVNTDIKTGLVTLSIVWRDPTLAAKWANDLVKITNDYLRSKAIEQSERNVAYLNEQAAKTDAIGVKQAIYAVMETEINKAMIARGNDEYALKVIDPAIAPERPSTPQPWLWTLAGLIGGLMISVLWAFIQTDRAI